MNFRSLLLVLLTVLLAACAPKYHYQNLATAEPEFEHILVVFDYLHFVDDVGKLMDYHEDKNQLQIEALKSVITNTLSANGFQGTVDFALISSGLGLNPENGFEHYIDGDLSETLIYPPFYLESNHHESFQHQLMASFADAQSVAFVPVSKKTQGFYADLRMNTLSFAGTDEYPDRKLNSQSRVGVLHIRAVLPKISFMKAMGVSLLTVGLTAGATGGAYIGIATPVGVPHSTGLLFDNQTGEVLWKNQTAGDLSRFGDQASARFFKQFPALD